MTKSHFVFLLAHNDCHGGLPSRDPHCDHGGLLHPGDAQDSLRQALASRARGGQTGRLPPARTPLLFRRLGHRNSREVFG